MLLKKGRIQAVLIENIRQLVEDAQYGDWTGSYQRPKMKKTPDITAEGIDRVRSRARSQKK